MFCIIIEKIIHYIYLLLTQRHICVHMPIYTCVLTFSWSYTLLQSFVLGSLSGVLFVLLFLLSPLPLCSQFSFLTQRISPLYRKNYDISCWHMDIDNSFRATLLMWDDQRGHLWNSVWKKCMELMVERLIKTTECCLGVSTCLRLWESICDQAREEACHLGVFILMEKTDNKQVSTKYNTF